MKGTIVFVFTILLALQAAAQSGDSVWRNKKCAIALTYDDALNVHLDHAIPVLDSLNLKGTFYISGYFPGFRDRIADWKKAAARGHELSNHTLYHPCTGKMPGREFVNPDYDLSNYSVRRMVDEMRMTNILLKTLDGKSKRTFAYPCGDIKIGDSSYIESMKSEFISARGVKSEMQKINEIDLFNIGAFGINGQSGDELIALVKDAMKSNSLLVFLFHGVGGEHSLNVSLSAHRQLLHFLKQNEKDIWIAPLVEISEVVKNTQSKNRKGLDVK
jgi:peptidoglycan-N-acetylglucosamine deacetylase